MLRRLTGLCLVLLALRPLGAAITVSNVAPGETLRYPVALLVGTADKGDTIEVANADNTRPDGRNAGPVLGGRFKLLVELARGANRLTLTAGGETLDLSLTWLPMTTPRRVTLVYLTGNEKETAYPTQVVNDPQTYEPRLRVAARLMQTFCAEAMNSLGYGRRTFDLEADAQGDPVVHTVAYPEPAATLRARDPNLQWHRTYDFLSKQLDYANTKVLCLNAFIAYDRVKRVAYGHTALGGGSQAVFSSNSLCAWPASLRDVQRAFDDATPVDAQQLSDDTAFRSTMWALASTGIGAWLHELGHTFGLPHSPDPRCIMSRGFDRFNRTFVVREAPAKADKGPRSFTDSQTARWDPLFAQRLAVNPWWQPDGPRPSGRPGPSLAYSFDTSSFLLKAPAGLAFVQIEGPKVRLALPSEQVQGRTELTLPASALRDQAYAPGGINVLAFDVDGRSATYDEAKQRNPNWFIHSWQLLAQARPWPTHPTPPTLDAAALSALTDDLRARPLEDWKATDNQPPLSVGFAKRYGGGDHQLAYALRSFRVEAGVRARLLLGHGGGVRVWLDGKLALDAAATALAAVDDERGDLQLTPGEHTLLVESSHQTGPWHLSLRLTTLDLKPLVLGDDGTLRPGR